MRYIIDFSYDGSNFNGYQKQPGKRTVQKTIEDVLSKINDKEVIIYASGRTDKGVNALHQIAHFDFDKEITCYKLKGALNSYLPDDIYVNDVKEVPSDFHARYMVKKKRYRYAIDIGIFNPVRRNQAFQYSKPLNLNKMKDACKFLIGKHDFTSFACAEDKRENKVRTIYDIKIEKKDETIYIDFVGSGFLKYQIRNMVGLLIKIGEEKFDENLIPSIIDKKDRRLIGNTAPACGLTLINVEF